MAHYVEHLRRARRASIIGYFLLAMSAVWLVAGLAGAAVLWVVLE